MELAYKGKGGGKAFEKDFLDGCEGNGIMPIRLYDPVGGFKGVANICDYIIYQYPSMYCLELKACKGNSFPFSRLTETQYTGMLTQTQFNDAVSGILLLFYEKVETQCVFVPINVLKYYIEDLKKKSITYADALKHGAIMVIAKKRTHFTFEPTQCFFNRCREAQIQWGD